MSLVFPILLGGLVLTAIPVLLHLIMRQKPRTLPFPAFRFLIQRHRTNLRKLRLRHLVLLALRVLLIVAICLALTRPRLFSQSWGLSGERPVAAVLVLDTSPSMDYKTSDGVSRLDEGKKRALEFVDELPEGSKVVVLDTGPTAQSIRGDWISKNAARERIGAVKVAAVSTPLAASLEYGYRLLTELARSKDDDNSRSLPRFVFVFSDRTRAAWDKGRQGNVLESSDQVPPALEGLQQARETAPLLMDLLKVLRDKLPPPAGQDYPEQALLDFLSQLRDRVSSLTKEDMPPDEKLMALVLSIQRRGRDLLNLLEAKTDNDGAAAPDEYRTRLMKSLQETLAHLRGAQGLFLDLGVENPVDLALLQLNLPPLPNGQARQLFSEDEKVQVNAVVRATGKNFSTTLLCKLDKKIMEQAVDIKAGETQTIPFEIDLEELKLGPGQHQLEVRFATPDLLAFNNQRYLTFAIREAQRVLVLADDPAKAKFFADALDVLKFRVEVKKPLESPKLDLSKYRAIYLFQLAAPDDALWNSLERYVQKGGGLGIVPGGEEMSVKAYASAAAQKLMPGTFKNPVAHGKDKVRAGAAWNLDNDAIYQHPLLAPFRNYKGNKGIDFIFVPRSAFYYWEVVPTKGEGSVLVRYNDPKQSPALLERQAERDNAQGGKIILFTTPLDARQPRWNDYLELQNSFYIVTVSFCTNYLTGQSEAQNFNFIGGQEGPAVVLSPTQRFAAYSLQGPGIMEQIAEPEGNHLTFRQATVPGNYVVEGAAKETKGSLRVAAFSVNVPAEESDLTRVPAAEIEAVFGLDSVLPIDRKAEIRTILKGHWTEPVELFPLLMVLLLLVLAIENLLANKFYKRGDEAKEAA